MLENFRANVLKETGKAKKSNHTEVAMQIPFRSVASLHSRVN